MENELNVRPLKMDLTGLKRDALAGEVAVVTGGGSNIGLGTARSLAWLGAKVVIAQRTAQTGAAAAAQAALADLDITMTGPPSTVNQGAQITYVITVRNLGTVDAPNIVILQMLPTGVQFVSMTTPSGFICGNTGGRPTCLVCGQALRRLAGQI